MNHVDTQGMVRPPLQRLWHDDGPAIGLAAAITIVLECGVFLAARCWAVPADRAALMTLLLVTLWIAVATAPLAAGGATRLGAFCRGVVVTDASIVVLIVLIFAGGGQLSWSAAAKIYLLWASLAVTLTLLVPLGSRRLLIAVVATVAAVAAVTSRFWSAGLLAAMACDSSALVQTTRSLAAFDVLAGVAAAASSAEPFVWAEQPVMYQLTRGGQDYPSAALAWWVPALTWWAAAAAVAAAIAVRRSACRFLNGT